MKLSCCGEIFSEINLIKLRINFLCDSYSIEFGEIFSEVHSVIVVEDKFSPEINSIKLRGNFLCNSYSI